MNDRKLVIPGNDAAQTLAVTVTASEDMRVHSPIHIDVHDMDGKEVASFALHRNAVRALAIHLMRFAP